MIEKEITTMNLNNAKYYGQNPQMNQIHRRTGRAHSGRC